MKKRPEGFLSDRNIDHESEIFDYIKELHMYLYRFVSVHLGVGGHLEDLLDIAIQKAEKKGKREDFEIFWREYPRKVGKGAALKAWVKAKPDVSQALKSLRAFIKYEWQGVDMEFIPHASTWLNRGSHEDELEYNSDDDPDGLAEIIANRGKND